MSQTAIVLGRSTYRVAALYALMIAGTVVLFLLTRWYGETLSPAAPAEQTSTSVAVAGKSHTLLHVLLALVCVIIAGQLLARVFAWLDQPPVIGEVLAGILLGPSLLGRISPEAYAYILPQDIAPYLGLIAQLGIVLYMFTVGLEFDAAVLRRHGHTMVAVSNASIAVPFALGALLALPTYSTLSSGTSSFTVYALFLGASMSVTAFPVLARILSDQQMQKTELGLIALACAAAGDVTAWCLLAFVVGVAQAEVNGALLVTLLTLGYIAAMFLIVRPLLGRWIPKADGSLTRGVAVAVFLGLLASAWLTEVIGIHAIFGAFLLGAIIPHDSVVAREFSHKLEDLVTIVFLPAFFAFTGMRTEIGLVSGWEDWLLCGAIILVAMLGKFGGTLAAARATGVPWRDSAALGVLMNTRGLMELIVLNIGLDLQVISPRLFAMMVIMALVTTIMTTPALRLLGAGRGAKIASLSDAALS